jgi:hypothetical protein
MALFSIKYCSEQVFDNPDSSKIKKVTAQSFEESRRMRHTVYHMEKN